MGIHIFILIELDNFHSACTASDNLIGDLYPKFPEKFPDIEATSHPPPSSTVSSVSRSVIIQPRFGIRRRWMHYRSRCYHCCGGYHYYPSRSYVSSGYSSGSGSYSRPSNPDEWPRSSVYLEQAAMAFAIIAAILVMSAVGVELCCGSKDSSVGSCVSVPVSVHFI